MEGTLWETVREGVSLAVSIPPLPSLVKTVSRLDLLQKETNLGELGHGILLEFLGKPRISPKILDEASELALLCLCQ